MPFYLSPEESSPFPVEYLCGMNMFAQQLAALSLLNRVYTSVLHVYPFAHIRSLSINCYIQKVPTVALSRFRVNRPTHHFCVIS